MPYRFQPISVMQESQRWEYMSILWEETRDISRDYAMFYIDRPGAEVDTRRGHDSNDPEAEHVRYLDLLQKFGAEGWEVVGETVLGTATVQALGWKAVQSPVRIRWTLKRLAS